MLLYLLCRYAMDKVCRCYYYYYYKVCRYLRRLPGRRSTGWFLSSGRCHTSSYHDDHSVYHHHQDYNCWYYDNYDNIVNNNAVAKRTNGLWTTSWTAWRLPERRTLVWDKLAYQRFEVAGPSWQNFKNEEQEYLRCQRNWHIPKVWSCRPILVELWKRKNCTPKVWSCWFIWRNFKNEEHAAEVSPY